MKKIAVIGVGTAGLLSVSHMLAYLPEEWQVFSIHDPNIPILGIGESTSVAIPVNFFKSTGFNIFLDSDKLDARMKLGAKYVGWREWDWYAKLSPVSYAINFNNFGLKDFCYERWPKIWGNKFVEIQGKLVNLINEDKSAKIIFEDGRKFDFDFVIDCRGFPDDYTNYDMVNSVTINHGLINPLNKPGTWDFTYQIAHRNGWMFGLPLNSRQGWGYLYNDRITDRADAIDDISERFKTKKEDLKLREFSWKNYRAKKYFDGRIAVNGNRALFYEPIEALAGGFYHKVCKFVYSRIIEDMPEQQCNDNLTKTAVDIELLLAYVYHGGSTYDTPFWQNAKNKANDLLTNSRYSEYFKEHMDYLKAMPPSQRSVDEENIIFPPTIWEDFDHGLGYHYLTSPEPNVKHPRFDPEREFSNIRIS